MGESETDERVLRVALVVRNGLVQIVEGLNEILQSYAPGEKPARAIPDLDISEIDKLPWVSYATKQPCTAPDEAGWIFADLQEPVAQELAKALRSLKGPLKLGNVEYKFSGKGNEFISRRPVKP